MGTPDPLLLGVAPAPVAANHPRSAVVSALLALLCPGLGHFYCGKVMAALAWSFAPWLLLVLEAARAVVVLARLVSSPMSRHRR